MTDAWLDHLKALRRPVPTEYVDVYFEDEEEGEDDLDMASETQPDELDVHPDKLAVEQPSEWVASEIDGDALLCDMFKPGVNHVTDGIRGGGKTFQAISYAQPIIEGKIKGMTKTILLTNVIFLKRVAKTGKMEDDFIMETPPDVYHTNSMEQMFRYITRFMKQYGRENVQFLVILDEVQNFLLAEEYQADLQITFIKWYGTTRKFNTCLWMLTPSINNLPPRARNFQDDDTKSGYVGYRWRKNKIAAARYIQEHNIKDVNPQEFTTLTMGAHEPPVMFRVCGTSWTRNTDDVEIGEYCYDHLACADFKLSIHDTEEEAFKFDELMALCSDLPSFKMAKVMSDFFDRMDGKMPSDGSSDIPSLTDTVEYKRALEIRRMRDMGLKIRQIAYVIGRPESTCRSWHDKFFDPQTGNPLRPEYAYDRIGGQPSEPVKAVPIPIPTPKPRGNAARKVKKSSRDARNIGTNGTPTGSVTPAEDISSLSGSDSETTPAAGAYTSIPENDGIYGGSDDFSLRDTNGDDGGVATVATTDDGVSQEV